MADGDFMIASAVILPDALDTPGNSPSLNTGTLKRRQSNSPSPEASKRARLSPEDYQTHSVQTNRSNHDVLDHNSPSNSVQNVTNSSRTPPKPQESSATRAERRKSGREEERKRGQRMFGALLGTLAGSGPRGAGAGVQKRRADIERRAQAKLKQLDEEGRQKEKETAEKARRRRRREQWVVDEQVMKTNHNAILMTARFLSTRAEPRLYYKPWELLPEEEDRIARQIEEAEDRIDREVDVFEHRRGDSLQELDRLEHGDKANDMAAAGPTGDNHADEIAAKVENPDIHTDADTDIAHATAETEERIGEISNKGEESTDEPLLEEDILDEHHGETVVEAEEDTVIY